MGCPHTTTLCAGFTGADLQNLMNESAIMAARRGLTEISKEEVADALERIVAGPEKKGAVVSDAKKRLVAFHEVPPLLLLEHVICSPSHQPCTSCAVYCWTWPYLLMYTAYCDSHLYLYQCILRCSVRYLACCT